MKLTRNSTRNTMTSANSTAAWPAWRFFREFLTDTKVFISSLTPCSVHPSHDGLAVQYTNSIRITGGEGQQENVECCTRNQWREFISHIHLVQDERGRRAGGVQ